MLEKLKLKIKWYFDVVSAAIVISNQKDYEKASAWLKKAKIVCGICSVLGIVYGVLVRIILAAKLEVSLGVLTIPLFLILGLWSHWGLATFILNIREILNIKKIFEIGKIAYSAGKEIKETHINVTHEFGNQYRVTSHTEHKGCLFAYIAIFVRFIAWMYFSVIVGAFLTVKKLVHTIRNIKSYQEKHNLSI